MTTLALTLQLPKPTSLTKTLWSISTYTKITARICFIRCLTSSCHSVFQTEYYGPQPILNRPPPPNLSNDGQPRPPAGQQQPLPLPPTPGEPGRVPVAPPVRIDTCIVGDDTTCTKEKNEVCRTNLGISSCFCRPGYGRKDDSKDCQSKRSFTCFL